MKSSTTANIGTVFAIVCILYTCGFEKRKEEESIWKDGYAEGYREAEEGVREGSIDFGPDTQPSHWGEGDAPKKFYRLQFQAYTAGYEDFKQGFPFNNTPPE